MVCEFWAPVCAAAFRGEVEEIPERPKQVDTAVILPGLGWNEAEFGVIKVVDLVISTDETFRPGC